MLAPPEPSTVDYARAVPHPALAGLIVGYGGYRERSTSPVGRRQAPTGSCTLILGFGSSLRLRGPTGTTERTAFLAGMHDAAVLTEFVGEQRGVQVDLSPLGLFTLLGRPVRELTNQVVTLDDLEVPELAALPSRLAEEPGWPARFARVDRVLRKALEDAVRRPDPEVVWAWRRLLRAAGSVRIEELANEVGWSRRHLLDRFAQQIGLSPKAAARGAAVPSRGGAARADEAGRWPTDDAGPHESCGPRGDLWLRRSQSPGPGVPRARPVHAHPIRPGLGRQLTAPLPFVQAGSRLRRTVASSRHRPRKEPTMSDSPTTVLTPYLIVTDGVAMLDWYRDIFGAVETTRYTGEDARIGHAELLIDGALLMLADEYPEAGYRGPVHYGGTPVTLHLEVADVDATYVRATESGATSEREPADQGDGSRRAVLRDPAGHRWMLSQPIDAERADAADRASDDTFTVSESRPQPA